MPTRPCPTCAHPTVRVLSTSDAESVHYYRCTHCGHVWQTPKADPDATPTTVMPGRIPGR